MSVNPVELKNSVEFAIDQRFDNLNGQLTLPRIPRPYKFCAECGDKVIFDSY